MTPLNLVDVAAAAAAGAGIEQYRSNKIFELLRAIHKLLLAHPISALLYAAQTSTICMYVCMYVIRY